MTFSNEKVFKSEVDLYVLSQKDAVFISLN